MPTYLRAGQFGPAAIPGAPRGVALRVVDASGSDAVLYRDASKNVIAGPIVYGADSGEVKFFADPGTYTVKWAGGQAAVTVAGGAEGSDAAPLMFLAADVLAAGQVVPPRIFNTATASFTVTSGGVHLTYFYGDKTEPINNVYVQSRGTAAGATPTLCRVGIWSEAANGDLTLVAAIANDTSLFAATNTGYTRALTSTFNKVLGARYAAGLLVVSGAALPTVVGPQQQATVANSTLNSLPPKLLGFFGGQTDLPNSIPGGSVASTSNGPSVYMS